MRSQHSFAKKILPGLLALPFCLPLTAEAQLLGGLLESPIANVVRPLLSRTGILNLLPQRGKFTFPAPYNTQAVRLTSEADCKGGVDCVNYIGYSYWSNINNHIGYDSMLIFVGMDYRLGGPGPTLFEYNKLNDTVKNLGPLFDDTSHLSTSSAEGWYFSGTGPTTLYIPDLNRLLRYDVISGATETVFSASAFGNDKYLWQMHSSADDRVHSATIRQNGSLEMLGCGVYREDVNKYQFYPRKGAFDECQIDKSGNWLVIKENVDGKDGEDNRIINVVTGNERVLLDRDGAGGHSDLGHGYMVATDNFAKDPNTIKVWDFTKPTLTGKVVYNNADWGVNSPNHITHSNSAPGVAIENQFACGSSVNRKNSSEANEIICFGLDGSKQTTVVAPVMTSFDAAGGRDEYAKMPKGNLDITGQYFIWTTNMGGNRLDAFVVKVPNLLKKPIRGQNGSGDYGTPSTPAPTPAPAKPTTPVKPTPAPTPAPAPAPAAGAWRASALNWIDQVNTTLSGNVLTKTGGCHGCADTGATSAQVLSSGNGYFEFTVQDASKLHFVGMSKQQTGTEPDDIDFAFRLQGGGAEVRENGVYKFNVDVVRGDKLRVTIEGGRTSYAKNGTVFYRSSVAPSYPMRAYVSLMAEGASIAAAVVGSDSSTVVQAPAAGGSTPKPPAATPPVTTPANGTFWANTVNAKATGGNLVKSGGCDGCSDSGAQSISTITGNNGYLEFSVDNSTPLQFIGLSSTSPGNSGEKIDYALRVQAGYAEVREKGVYRNDVWLKKGDVLRIAVKNGQVSYLHNGTVFHTSDVKSNSTLRSYATMSSSGSSIQNAKLVSGS